MHARMHHVRSQVQRSCLTPSTSVRLHVCMCAWMIAGATLVPHPLNERTIEAHGPYQHGNGFSSTNGHSKLLPPTCKSSIPIEVSACVACVHVCMHVCMTICMSSRTPLVPPPSLQTNATRCAALPPIHLTTSPPHHLTTSPPHHLTTSPPHLLTSSPPHLTSSPPHHLTMWAGGALPPGWQAVFDPASGQTFFCNSMTGATTWNHPSGAV